MSNFSPLFKELYNDSQITAVGIVSNNELVGLNVTFKSLLARRIHYKTNGQMFVYQGRWFKGQVELDHESSLYMNVERYGYLILSGDEVQFKEIRDVKRL